MLQARVGGGAQSKSAGRVRALGPGRTRQLARQRHGGVQQLRRAAGQRRHARHRQVQLRGQAPGVQRRLVVRPACAQPGQPFSVAWPWVLLRCCGARPRASGAALS